jgi:hypothetical protein
VAACIGGVFRHERIGGEVTQARQHRSLLGRAPDQRAIGLGDQALHLPAHLGRDRGPVGNAGEALRRWACSTRRRTPARSSGQHDDVADTEADAARTRARPRSRAGAGLPRGRNQRGDAAGHGEFARCGAGDEAGSARLLEQAITITSGRSPSRGSAS